MSIKSDCGAGENPGSRDLDRLKSDENFTERSHTKPFAWNCHIDQLITFGVFHPSFNKEVKQFSINIRPF